VPEQLQPVAPLVHEHEQRSAPGILRELLARHVCEPHESAPHVHRRRRRVDLHAGGDHRRASSTATSRASSTASKPLGTRTVRPETSATSKLTATGTVAAFAAASSTNRSGATGSERRFRASFHLRERQ
jgi:hypothetical protein